MTENPTGVTDYFRRRLTIICDGCGATESGDYAGETPEIRHAAVRRHVAETKGWTVAAPDDPSPVDLCPACIYAVEENADV